MQAACGKLLSLLRDHGQRIRLYVAWPSEAQAGWPSEHQRAGTGRGRTVQGVCGDGHHLAHVEGCNQRSHAVCLCWQDIATRPQVCSLKGLLLGAACLDDVILIGGWRAELQVKHHLHTQTRLSGDIGADVLEWGSACPCPQAADLWQLC